LPQNTEGTLNADGGLSLKLGSALLGYSEQAYHKAERHHLAAALKQTQLEALVSETIVAIRERMPHISNRMLTPWQMHKKDKILIKRWGKIWNQPKKEP
jgi:hypothetical protein